MSSAPAEPEVPKKPRRFETWRKIMLVGAFILLAHALVVALIDDPIPEFATMAAYFVGYAFLLVGFGVRMRDYKEAKEAKAKAPSGH